MTDDVKALAERTAFIEAHGHLDLSEISDGWGRPMFQHSHVEAIWSGWKSRAAIRSSYPWTADALAQQFHETYERLAPSFGYKTREASAKPWSHVPDQNKNLMIAVCADMLVRLASQREDVIDREGDIARIIDPDAFNATTTKHWTSSWIIKRQREARERADAIIRSLPSREAIIEKICREIESMQPDNRIARTIREIYLAAPHKQ